MCGPLECGLCIEKFAHPCFRCSKPSLFSIKMHNCTAEFEIPMLALGKQAIAF